MACFADGRTGPSYTGRMITLVVVNFLKWLINDITMGVYDPLKMYIKLPQSATMHRDMPFFLANLWHICATSASVRSVMEWRVAEEFLMPMVFDGVMGGKYEGKVVIWRLNG